MARIAAIEVEPAGRAIVIHSPQRMENGASPASRAKAQPDPREGGWTHLGTVRRSRLHHHRPTSTPKTRRSENYLTRRTHGTRRTMPISRSCQLPVSELPVGILLNCELTTGNFESGP